MDGRDGDEMVGFFLAQEAVDVDHERTRGEDVNIIKRVGRTL